MSERIEVPAREGRALRVEAGRRFRVIDLEGGQVADTWAFVADDPTEFHSAQHTAVHVGRLFPRSGIRSPSRSSQTALGSPGSPPSRPNGAIRARSTTVVRRTSSASTR